jgi:aspartyl protease family protein
MRKTNEPGGWPRRAALLRWSRATAGTALAIAGVLQVAAGASAQTIRYEVFDGRMYTPAQLALAARSPIQNEAPRLAGGVYLVPRSADGQYHIAGWINGFPVVFLVDTGAAMTSIPLDAARDAGIRAGQQALVSTANGVTTAWTSRSNVLSFGGFTVGDVDVQVAERLHFALLGMNVLNRFQIGYSNGYMTLKAPQSP